MVLTVYWLLVNLLLIELQDSSANTNTDGFNIYKDLLRNKAEETDEAPVELSDGPKMYFYRAPQLYLVPALTDQPEMMTSEHLGKRNSNRFKNYMLVPPQRDDEFNMDKPHESPIYHFPRVVVKREAERAPEDRPRRGPGSILTWALYSKHLQAGRGDQGFFTPFSVDSFYRLPTGGRSSAFVATMGKRTSQTKH